MKCGAALCRRKRWELKLASTAKLTRKSTTSTTLFWGAWSRHRDSFIRAAETGDQAYLFRQYAENADALAAIACGKYRCVSFAFRGLLVTVLAYICLLAVK